MSKRKPDNHVTHCLIQGCRRKQETKGLCRGHRFRLLDGHSLCRAHECGNPVESEKRGMCEAHRRQYDAVLLAEGWVPEPQFCHNAEPVKQLVTHPWMDYLFTLKPWAVRDQDPLNFTDPPPLPPEDVTPPEEDAPTVQDALDAIHTMGEALRHLFGNTTQPTKEQKP